MPGSLRPWTIALLLAAGCNKGPSKDQCTQLLDHLVDLEFKKAGAAEASDAMKSEIAKQKKAASEAKAEEFLDSCTNKTSRARVECALSATNLDTDLAKCDEITK
jgi:hypothetical protein